MELFLVVIIIISLIVIFYSRKDKNKKMDTQYKEIETIKEVKPGMWERHKGFITGVYSLTAFPVGIYSFFVWINLLFNTAKEGNFIGFLVTLAFQGLIMGINILIGTAFWGSIAVIILIIPYLIVKGIRA